MVRLKGHFQDTPWNLDHQHNDLGEGAIPQAQTLAGVLIATPSPNSPARGVCGTERGRRRAPSSREVTGLDRRDPQALQEQEERLALAELQDRPARTHRIRRPVRQELPESDSRLCRRVYRRRHVDRRAVARRAPQPHQPALLRRRDLDLEDRCHLRRNVLFTGPPYK